MKKKRLLIVILILVFLNLVLLSAFVFVRARSNAGTAEAVHNTLSGTKAQDAPVNASLTAAQSSGRIDLRAARQYSNLLVRSAGENTAAAPMTFENMFPGDSVTGRYTLTLWLDDADQSKSVLCWYIEQQEGADETLLGGLDVTLEQNGQTVWQGKASEMMGARKCLVQNLYELGGKRGARNAWDVTITVSLPTSAGNEYQNLRAGMDFCWLVCAKEAVPAPDAPDEGETHENIPVVAPGTEDSFRVYFYLAGAAVAVVLILSILFISLKKRKEARHEN